MKSNCAMLASVALLMVFPLAGTVHLQQEPRALALTATIDVRGDEVAPTAVNHGVRSFMFLAPVRCDAAGTMYFVPAGNPAEGSDPVIVARVGRDGGMTTTDLGARMGQAGRVRIVSLAVTPAGAVSALVAVRDPTGARRAIVGLGGDGAVLWTHYLDERMLAVDAHAAFDSGEILLVGHDPKTLTSRLAIVTPGTEDIREISSPLATARLSRPRLLVESGPGNLAYVSEDPGRVLYSVSPGGDITSRFEMIGPPDLALRALRFSGGRLAAVYEGPSPDEPGSVVRWVSVQDAATGRHIAVYGPVPKMVVCYEASGLADRLTLFQSMPGGWQLLTAAP